MFSDVYEIERAFRDGSDFDRLRRAATPPRAAQGETTVLCVIDAPSIVSELPEDEAALAPPSLFATWMSRVRHKLVHAVTTEPEAVD